MPTILDNLEVQARAKLVQRGKRMWWECNSPPYISTHSTRVNTAEEALWFLECEMKRQLKVMLKYQYRGTYRIAGAYDDR
jgi:putative IMPACT (imprinted ancient) family translation regulator